MDLVVTLFIISGTIGAADILYYHWYKFRLYKQPGSRLETLTHVFRSFTFGIGVFTLLHYLPLGGWYWAVAGLFAADFIDEIIDIVIEPKSREPLGGLPGREYLVHMVSTTLNGGAWVAFLVAGWAGRGAATALVARHPALPAWLVLDGNLVVGSSLLIGTAELVLLLRSWTTDRAPAADAAT
jgi:hypothetical protein